MDIKIAVAYHKESFVLHHKYFIPVHAGKAVSNLDLHMQGDDEGDNISYKNPWYCELTALYWLWKNTKADYKGLMHYRRAFVVKKDFDIFRFLLRLKFITRRLSSLWSPYSSVGVKKQYECKSSDVFNTGAIDFANKLEGVLAGGVNIIAPHPGRFYMSLRRTLSYEVGGQNLELMDEIVRRDFPDFFPHYDKAMDGLWLYNCNMSVMDNDTFEEYCNILFSVLESHEKESMSRGYLIDVSKEKAYARVSGYLAEMLTNAFIRYSAAKGKKVKVLPVVYLK